MLLEERIRIRVYAIILHYRLTLDERIAAIPVNSKMREVINSYRILTESSFRIWIFAFHCIKKLLVDYHAFKRNPFPVKEDFDPGVNNLIWCHQGYNP